MVMPIGPTPPPPTPPPDYVGGSGNLILDSLSLSEQVSQISGGQIDIQGINLPLGLYAQIINQLSREFKTQLSASELQDQQNNEKLNLDTSLQALAFGNIAEKVAIASAAVPGKRDAAVIELQALLDYSDSSQHNMIYYTNQINGYVGEENSAINTWNNDGMRDWSNAVTGTAGAHQVGGGFYLPAWNLYQFNTPLTQAQADFLNGKMSTFVSVENNQLSYAAQANSRINGYNDIANTHNSNSVPNANTAVDNLLLRYNIPVDNDTHIKADAQTYPAYPGLRSYLADVSFSQSGAFHAGDIYAYVPDPTFMGFTANRSAITVQTPVDLPPATDYKQRIEDNLNEIDVKPLVRIAALVLNTWAYGMMIKNYDPPIDKILVPPDPVLQGSKPIAKKILREAENTPGFSTPNDSKAGGLSLSVLSTGLGSPALQSVLNKGLLSQIVNTIQQSDIDPKVKEKLVTNLTILTAGFLGNNAFQAALPSLGFLATHLNSLPRNSPAYPILFATSFANRISELTGSGTSEKAIKNLISQMPELKGLSETEKASLSKELAGAINIALLLVSAVFLAKTMGLEGLTPQLLAQLPGMTPEVMAKLVGSAETEGAKTGKGLADSIEQAYIAKGFGAEEAKFLGQFGAAIAEQGLLSPTATTVSPTSVEVGLLTDSLVAQLVEGGTELGKARALGETAIKTTMAGGPFASTSQFTQALENTLRGMGLGNQAYELSSGVVLYANSESRLKTLAPEARTKDAFSPGLPAGVQTLLNQLPAALPPNLAKSLTGQLPLSDDPAARAALLKSIQEGYLKQGYTVEEAKSLSQALVAGILAAETKQKALESATVTKEEAEAPPEDLAVKEIMAALIRKLLAGLLLLQLKDLESSLRLSAQVSREIEKQIGDEEAFKRGLQMALISRGINKEDAARIASQTSVSTGVETGIFSEAALLNQINQRILSLLGPQLGAELSKEATHEIAKALFGTPNPDNIDKAELKSSIALLPILINEVRLLKLDHNEKTKDKLVEGFKESIKPSVDLDTFLRKLMDPANAYITAFSGGLMYQQTMPANFHPDIKRSVDIAV